jgi:hypothetical protein
MASSWRFMTRWLQIGIAVRHLYGEIIALELTHTIESSALGDDDWQPPMNVMNADRAKTAC